MALFVLGDPHLSLGASKPMDIFPGWNDYVDRLEKNWRKLIKPEDTIVLAGDISWAMRLTDTRKDFEFLQSLLHAFPGDVPRDGDILCFASDFVDFIYVDDALFRFRYVKVGSLEQAQDDVFHIFPYVTGFRQRGGVHNAEWDVEHFRQRFRQQGFS